MKVAYGSSLSTIFGSRVRAKVLAYLADRDCIEGFRPLAEALGEDVTGVYREVRALEKTGLIVRGPKKKIGKGWVQIFYVNKNHGGWIYMKRLVQHVRAYDSTKRVDLTTVWMPQLRGRPSKSQKVLDKQIKIW